MEMNDNHVEMHTCGEFLTFCVGGPTRRARDLDLHLPGQVP